MARVLHVVASPRAEAYSSRLADQFLTAYGEQRPQDAIERLDLFRAEIPDFLAPAAKAKYAVMSGGAADGETETAWRKVIDAIDHFKSFDKYVLSTGMWNFTVPYRLKQYIDVIVQPGLTFSFSPERGYVGLVTDRPLMLIMASGGEYGPGDPRETHDFLESYLRGVFGFIGFSDVHVIRVQGTLQNKPERIEADLKTAVAAAQQAAQTF